MATRRRIKRDVLELLLLLVVLAQLLYWFSDAFGNPLANPGAAFRKGVWMGLALPAREKDLVAAACATSSGLSPASQAWCQSHVAEGKGLANWLQRVTRWQMLEPAPTTEPVPAIRLMIEQTRAYQQLQDAFRKVAAQPVDRTPETVDVNTVSPTFMSWLKTTYGIQASGSGALECSWWALQGLELRQAGLRGDIMLWRAQLLHGVTTEGGLPAGVDWTLVPADRQASCAALGNVRQVQAMALAAVNELYQQQDLRPRSLQMLALSQYGHWLFAAWALTAWGVIRVLRQPLPPLVRLVVHASAWTLAWWLSCRVLGGEEASALPTFPAFSAGLWAVLFLTVLWLPRTEGELALLRTAQRSASPWILPGFVLLTGIGYFMLIDWCLNGYEKMRFLALRQINAIFLAFMLLSAMPLLGGPLYRGLARILAYPIRWQQRAWRTSFATWVTMTGLMLLVVLIFALLLRALHSPQFTSELTRLLALLTLTVFMGGLSLSRQQSATRVTLLILLLLGVFVLVVQGVSSDFGPIMIMIYVSSALLCAVITAAIMAMQASRQKQWLPMTLLAGIGGGVLALSVVFRALYMMSAYGNATMRERLVSQQQPFASTNDQMALVSFFLESVPPAGYGLGHVPWLGDGRGVPEQAHSDYVPMMLYGLFGSHGFWLFVMAYLVWLALIIRGWQQHTRGDHSQFSAVEMYGTFLGWLSVIWGLCTLVQLCMTVAGNLLVSPLTGISVPLVSFGWVSLLLNTLVVGLLCNTYVSPGVNPKTDAVR